MRFVQNNIMAMAMAMAGERSARQGGKLETLLVQVASRKKKRKRHAAPFRFPRFMTVNEQPANTPSNRGFCLPQKQNTDGKGQTKTWKVSVG